MRLVLGPAVAPGGAKAGRPEYLTRSVPSARRCGRPNASPSRIFRYHRPGSLPAAVDNSLMREPSDRLPYSAIIDRPPLPLPGGAPLAVWVIVNVELWSIARAMPRTVLTPPMGQPLLPDVPNWSWHEYGMRVGFWRLMEALRSEE